MKRINLWVLLGLLFATSLTSLFTSFSASALSDYDNVVYSVDKVNLPVYDNQLGTYEYEDITTTWYEYFSSNSTAKTDFDNARDNGGHWAVITNANEVTVVWSTDTNVKTEFFFAYGLPSFGIQNGNTWSTFKFSKIKQTEQISSSYYDNQTSVNTFLNGDKPTPLPTETGFVFSNYDVIYPPEYEGATIPDSVNIPNPEDNQEWLYPNYQYSITNSVLKIKYLNNLPHFLTGENDIVVEKWTDNWGENDQLIESRNVNPAGWTDEDFTLSSGGYYLVRIDHSQQLDSPPWDSGDNEKYYIAQRYIRINWDGTSNITGSTADCSGNEICGDKPAGQDDNRIWNLFNSLGDINTFGLQSFIMSPINFLQDLPDMVDNCSPISFPLFGSSVTLPCMKSMYWDWSATIMNMYTIIINGTVAYVVALNIFRHVKDINSPHKDGIQVANL